MTLTQIQYFHTLAKVENMHRAADLLYISQPSLSSALQKLEQELDVKLFDRIGHRISLTQAGLEFDNHCQKILQEVSIAKKHMKRISLIAEQQITLGCVEPLLRDYLPFHMRCFLTKPENNQVEFDIQEGTTPKLVEQLKDGVLDFLLCSEVEDPELDQYSLVKTPLVLIRHLLTDPSAPDLPYDTLLTLEDSVLQNGLSHIHTHCPFSWSTLAEIPMLGYSKKSSMDHLLNDLWLSLGIEPAYRYRMPNETAISSLVSNGFGSAIIPKTTDLTSFALEIYPLPSGNYQRSICLTTRKGHPCIGASKRFLDYMLTESH